MALAKSSPIIELSEDIISHEEVSMWSMEALKSYCQRRGYKVSGTKKELVSRVYVLYNSKISEKPGAKEEEAAKKRDYKNLCSAKYPAPDPYKLKTWQNEKDGVKNWPPVSYVDIDWFMRQNDGAGLTKESLTAYKTGKAFSYFSCEWLKEVFYSPISKKHECCYVKTMCTPSNRTNDTPHSLWVKIVKTTGEVISAYCSCVAGLSQTCNHVAALLFKLEAAFKLDMSNPSCTSTACSWKLPSNSKAPFQMKLQEILFTKPSHVKGRGASSTALPSSLKQISSVREFLVEDSDPAFYKDFISDLKDGMPEASIFLPGRTQMTSHNQQSHVKPSSRHPIHADLMLLASQCCSVKEFLNKMAMTEEEIAQIERNTVGQANNEMWVRLRKGRITASNFYRVFTKMETIKKDSSVDCSKLITSLLDPAPIDYLPQIKRGIECEPLAAKKVVTILSEHHRNVVVQDCGLFIHTSMPYLGASPDGIVTCDCCPKRLLEIKCPSVDIKSLTYLDSDANIKVRSNYYGQVQGQMEITKIHKTLFFIYTDEDSLLKEIDYDEEFCSSLITNIGQFYQQFLVYSLLVEPESKRSKLC